MPEAETGNKRQYNVKNGILKTSSVFKPNNSTYHICNDCKLFGFQIVDFGRIRWMLLQRRVVCSNFAIHVFVTIIRSIPLLVH